MGMCINLSLVNKDYYYCYVCRELLFYVAASKDCQDLLV